MKRPISQARLIGLTLLAGMLFMPPLLLLFDRTAASGLSWLPIYVFAVWLAVIGLAAWLLEGSKDE